MSEFKKVSIQNFLESQIPEFLNDDNPLFREFLNQYYISLEHQTGTIDLVNNLTKYKSIDNFNGDTFYNSTIPCILQEDLESFGTTVTVNTTIGFPDKYGLLKINGEILTYSSKTDTTFEDCVRGFSGIDKIGSKSFFGEFNFTTSSANFHEKDSIIENLNIVFFEELFRKFKYQFLPGFENRKFAPGLSLQNILTRAKDFYTTKGTDISYKILFRVLFNEEVDIIKPQDYMLRPSDNKYFITKNLLVEKIFGDLDPLTLSGETLFQQTPSGVSNAAIYNIEFRPFNNKVLYEISLDPETINLNFISTKKTNLLEKSSINQNILTVDSTVGFPNSGELVVQSANANIPVTISYKEKTLNQFLGVDGNIIPFEFGDTLIENNFAYVNINEEIVYFRLINVIEDVDYSTTSGLREGDLINLSSFGLELGDKIEYKKWIYNIPTTHKIKSIIATAEDNIWNIELFDGGDFIRDQKILVIDDNLHNDIPSTAIVRNIISSNIIEVVCDRNITGKNIISKTLTKTNFVNYPEISGLLSNIQNTYIDSTEENFYVSSSGIPDYQVFANDRKNIISTPINPTPFIGTGTTTILNTTRTHLFYTGEQIYLTPDSTLGINTGVYFIKTLGNYLDSQQISLSFSHSDLFSGKYINVSYNSGGNFVKLDYENKTVKSQKLLKTFSLSTEDVNVLPEDNRSTNNKPVGILLNGVELYSSTLYDENIFYGKLEDIEVTSSGVGYDVINSPELFINDTIEGKQYGVGAKAHINLTGSVQRINIVNPGSGYDDRLNISILGGNGNGATLEANIVKTRIVSGFRGDGTGINPTNDSISFVFPHNFEDGEVIEYFSNGNLEIEYRDPVTSEIRQIPSNSFYFAGVLSDTVIKLYRTKEDAAQKKNEINLTTSPSFGFHYFKSLDSKYSLVEVLVKNSGSLYSNKKVIIPAIGDGIRQQNGINIVDNYIFAKNHNFNDKDLVVYNTTGDEIIGLVPESKYYIKVIDKDSFNLAFAGIGNDISDSNFLDERYVRFSSIGSGTHIFSYPKIEIKIEAYPESANGKLVLPILEPVVLGSIDSVFVEERGEKYGVPDIINFHRRPTVQVGNITSEALLKPIIIDGIIVEVQILNYGRGYNKDIDLIITGKGNFADLYPVVENGRITSIIIINGGLGYDEKTIIRVQRRGLGAKFLASIFEWKINQVEKNKSFLSNVDEGILVPSKNQPDSLQFIHFYPPKVFRRKLNDNLNNRNQETLRPEESPILGWAYDGNPIYGPYAVIDNEIKRVRSSYRKSIEQNSNLRPTGVNFPEGFFIQDYIFDKNHGDLDEYNGRYLKNSDFPDGTYAYFYDIDIDNNNISYPEYPYIIATEFKKNPQKIIYDPKYNQDLDFKTLDIIRNTSPYYLNSATSSYGLIQDVDKKYKQEFIVDTVVSSGIDAVKVYDPGNNYNIGDIVEFDNKDRGGSGIYASISRVRGKEIVGFNVGVSTFYPVVFVKRGNIVNCISDSPFEFFNNDVINISNISDPEYRFLEGNIRISVQVNTVGLTNNIGNLGNTGNITDIFLTNIQGFDIGDYIKIDEEVLKIIRIIPQNSSITVERLSSIGIHTSGISQVELLPRKFSFVNTNPKITDIQNTTTYFDPASVIAVGAESKEIILPNNEVIIIPGRGIYLPGHSYFTGQPLTYNSGVDGTELFVYNSPNENSFQFEENQTVYAVNLGRDFIGISTLGFNSPIGIGSTNNSLYFDPSVTGVGLAHSFTTQYSEVYGKVENYSINVTTDVEHNLSFGDKVKLNLIPETKRIIPFRYDPIIQKITTGLINFDTSNIDVSTSEIDIDDRDLRTGDKVVYYSNGNSEIGELIDNSTYFVSIVTPGKIKLSNYYADAIQGNTIEFSSSGSGIHSIAKINPLIEVTTGNTIIFDVSDPSLGQLVLRLYRDSEFTVELESYNYISNSGERYIKTTLDVYPRELYYSFCATNSPVCSDVEVKNNNLIEIVDSTYNDEFDIIIIDDKQFKINLSNSPESLEYTKKDLSNLEYSTNSSNTSGPIKDIKLNYAGNGYYRIPKVSRILSSSGNGALLKAKSNSIGKISSLSRVKDGFDYPSDSTLLPYLSVPALARVEGISRVDYVGIVTGGFNYNVPPSLKVIGNDRIKLQAILEGTSVVDVKILENTNDLLTPLRVVPVRNSNGYSIDDIEVFGNNVTLELLNSDNQIYPLVTVGYGKSEFIFPFEVGDDIFIERCRISLDELDQNGTPIQKNNYNSSDYNFRFFTITGVSTENYTITYSMEGIGSNLGNYNPDFGYGIVVNRKNMAEFEMVTANDLSYISEEKVLGYNERNINTFSATVMKDGWDNDINELRMVDAKGELKEGYKLKGQTSLLDGIVTDVNIFNLRSTLGAHRDKLNDLGDRVGVLNDYQQRISDNDYYQKFSYSIRGKIPYSIWKEPVKSIIHPSGFKEFSDLSIESIADATMRVGTASSLDLTVNIDNLQSLYEKNNFGMVTEEDQFEDGSIERIIFEEGVVLRPYLLSKTNRVVIIDDISPEFTGSPRFQIVANKPVTFISTDLYRLGVSTEGLKSGDRIGFSTYHFYPDSTFILDIGTNFVELSKDTPHKLYSLPGGISTSVTENLDFYRRVPGDVVVGETQFKLRSNGTPIFYREFDASNGITTSINLENDSFIINNHNFQTGQKVIYTPEYEPIIAIASTTVGSGAILEPVFVGLGYSVANIKVIDGGSGYSTVNLPKIEILGTNPPLAEGIFVPEIEVGTGIITNIQIVDSGFGYFPISPGEIGIQTTSETEDRTHIVMAVGGGIGSAIYENGYNVAITTISGISSSIEPNFSGQQNRFWGFFPPYIPADQTSGSGIDAAFSVFIVYDSTTGNPISTSMVLRDGGRGYSVGDEVSIAGTFMGGSSPENDLSFIVSKVSNTRISNQIDESYTNVPSTTPVGYGTGAIFNVFRDSLGDIGKVEVLNGGINYSLTDNITIAGTYIGGNTPLDNLFLSPIVLGRDTLPKVLYIEKFNNNTFKVAGLSTGGILSIETLGVGTHSFELENPNVNTIITIDNIIQTPVYKKNITLILDQNISLNENIIYIQGDLSVLSLNDILQIDDEYMFVKNINAFGIGSVLVERSVLGTKEDIHKNASIVYVLSGNYNIIQDNLHFTSAPYGPTGLPGLEINSSFSGRAFSRRVDPFIPNDKNIIFDDISDQFTGIAATEFVLKSDGVNVSGIFTNTNSISGSSGGVDINNNPIILINNIPQTGGQDFIIDTPENNTIKFISGVPVAGKITQVGINSGFGYLPLVGASATVSVSPTGTISNVFLTGFGDGYKEPPLVTVLSNIGAGASIMSSIGVGGTVTQLTIINPGFGYTSTEIPRVRIDLPQNHYNLDLVYEDGYSGEGQGAKGSVVVGNGSSVISFVLDEPGVSYTVGEVLIAPGITTDPKSSSFEEFKITIMETYTDSFSGWYPGQFIQFDDFSQFFNGFKKKFTLTVTIFGDKEILSLRANVEDVIITNNLFVYINDILQVPNESYVFTGTRIIFKEAPKAGSKCNVLFFRGSDLDVEQIDPPRTIKEGDVVQIDENIFDPFDRRQFDRVVKNIVTTDILDTFPYDSLGISTDTTKIRPLNWTKQTQDRIMNGVLYSKSRPNLKSKIIPTAKIIKDIQKIDSKIYVDSAIPLFSDIDSDRGLAEELRDVIIVNNRKIENPSLKSIVSLGGTISEVQILDPGSGYKNIINPTISISSKHITRKDPIFNWNKVEDIDSNLTFNSIAYGNKNFVAVGNSGAYVISNDGKSWEVGESGITSDRDFVNVIGSDDIYVATGKVGSIFKTVGVDTTSNWEKIDLQRIAVDALGRPSITDSDYIENLNKAIYDKGTLIVVGNFGGIFSGVGIDTTGVYERGVSIGNLNSVSSSPSIFVAVGDLGDILTSEDGILWSQLRRKVTIQNLNDIIWDGSKFVVVGNNGTILSSTNGLVWNQISVVGFNKNLIEISYNNNLYTVLDSNNKFYFSLNLQYWVEREILPNIEPKSILGLGVGDEEIYISVGQSGLIVYSTPVFNLASVTSFVSNEKINNIIVDNGGFGYSTEESTSILIETDACEKEQIFSIKSKGDFGIIRDIKVYETGNIGFGTTSPAMEFTLESENYNVLLPTMEYFPLQQGDYFIISNSNAICGHALTGITTSIGGMSNYPNSKIGTATTFIDGIYRVETTTEPSLGIATVRCHFAPIPVAFGPDKIEVNIGINTIGYYGRYSFGIIFDYQNRARENPQSFIINKDNGLVGLDTGPLLYRTRGLF